MNSLLKAHVGLHSAQEIARVYLSASGSVFSSVSIVAISCIRYCFLQTIWNGAYPTDGQVWCQENFEGYGDGMDVR